MAIEKRAGKKRTTFRVYWTNPVTGKRDHESFDDLFDAEIFNAKIKQRLKKDPNSFAPKDSPASTTFRALAALYIKRKDLSQSTLDSTLYVLSQKINPIIGDVDVPDLTKKRLKEMEAVWREKGNKQLTINRQMSIVKAILNWAEDEELIAENPVPRYTCKRGPVEKIPPPSPQELSAIYEASPDHLRRAIILGAGIGARIGPSELLSIKWADMRWEEKSLIVWSADKNEAMPWREIPLSAPLLAALALWKSQDAPEVETIIHRRGKPIKSFKTAWKTALERAGITRRIRPYELRHYFATRALGGGADIKATAANMGHADESMILKTYQHVLPEKRRESVEKVELPTVDLGHFLGHFGTEKGVFDVPSDDEIKQ